MKTRDVIIGFIFIVILIAGIWWVVKNRSQKTSSAPIPTPNIVNEVNKAFPNLNIPDGADRADLKNVNGSEGVGVATRQKTNGQSTITVMANLPDPKPGSYTVTLNNGTNNLALGRMEITKSGYLVNFVTVQDISTFKKVTVSNGSTTILEGSF